MAMRRQMEREDAAAPVFAALPLIAVIGLVIFLLLRSRCRDRPDETCRT